MQGRGGDRMSSGNTCCRCGKKGGSQCGEGPSEYLFCFVRAMKMVQFGLIQLERWL